MLLSVIQNGQGPEKSCTDWLEGLPLPWHMSTPLAITYLDNLWWVLDSFKVHNILWIHASNCNWLNYGKVIHSRASCYITWQLSNKTINDLHGYANNLALKNSTPQPPRAISCLGWAYLSLEVFTFFIFMKLSFKRLRYKISLCILTKNWGPQERSRFWIFLLLLFVLFLMKNKDMAEEKVNLELHFHWSIKWDKLGLGKHHYEQSQWRWQNSSWATSNPNRWQC